MEMAREQNSKQLFGAVIILLGAILIVISLIVLQQGITESAFEWSMISQFQLSENNELRTWWPLAVIGIGVFLILSPKNGNGNQTTKGSNRKNIRIDK